MASDPFSAFKHYQKEARRLKSVREYFVNIPEELSVVADELAGPTVSGRKTITRWPDTRFHIDGCPDLILLREPLSKPAQSDLDSLFKKCHKSN